MLGWKEKADVDGDVAVRYRVRNAGVKAGFIVDVVMSIWWLVSVSVTMFGSCLFVVDGIYVGSDARCSFLDPPL